MKRIALLFCLQLFAACFCVAQMIEPQVLRQDFDGDYKTDSVWLTENAVHYKLSGAMGTEKVIPIGLPLNTSLQASKAGFVLSISVMRSGDEMQFRYAPTVRKFRLIGLRRYSFGSASNTGSGHESYNYLTGQYSACWNYYDHKARKLRGFPEMKTTLKMPVIYLEQLDA